MLKEGRLDGMKDNVFNLNNDMLIYIWATVIN